jgi:hypothetical protein
MDVAPNIGYLVSVSFTTHGMLRPESKVKRLFIEKK